MVSAALTHGIRDEDCQPDPIFGILVPKRCPDVPANILNPKNTWRDAAAFAAKARELAGRFNENFKKFSGVSSEVVEAAPRVS